MASDLDGIGDRHSQSLLGRFIVVRPDAPWARYPFYRAGRSAGRRRLMALSLTPPTITDYAVGVPQTLSESSFFTLRRPIPAGGRGFWPDSFRRARRIGSDAGHDGL